MTGRFEAFKKPWRVGAGLVLGLALGRAPGLAGERPGEGPPDLTPYQRPLVAEERGRELAQPPAAPGATVVDLVVAAGLDATDRLNDGETSIAVDPQDPDHVTISSFSGSWGPFAPIWVSGDGGATWTKSFTVSLPPAASGVIGCPCDQTFDYGRSSASLYGTFLDKRQGQDGSQDFQQTWTGDSGDPSAAASWQWPVTAGAADATNHSAASDQPWLTVNRDPDVATRDDVYVGYTDYAPDTPENLLGGSEAVAVDPANGDVYYVYHNRDARTRNNRLEISRLTAAARGGLRIVLNRFVTGQVQAALPAVAVAANGTVGVLYDTYDGMVAGFPQFTVHLAQSTNHGGSWLDQRIVTFLSPTQDTGMDRQRVLGDYQQLKSVGDFFYAAFPANGAAAGRSISNIDPFFLKLPAAGAHR